MEHTKYIQHVSAFKRQDRLILVSNVKTEEGLWFLHKPIKVLETNLPPSEIGLAVIRALSQSQTSWSEPPSPAELDSTMENLFIAADVETFDQFVERALHCGVGQDSTGIEISPTHNGGTQGNAKGFYFISERRILVESYCSPEQLGIRFLKGFAYCTSIYE